MATHAHSTRTPLLPQPGNPRPLLRQGLGLQLGPVTQAIRAMRAAEIGTHVPTLRVCPHVRADAVPTWGHAACAHVGAVTAVPHVGHETHVRHGIRALSRTEVEDLIGGLIDLLDAMDGDTDREPEEPEASTAEWAGRGAHRFNVGEAA